jgi:hypothetical protein
MRAKNIITILIVVCILVSTLMISSPRGVYAATVFADNYESGDYSNWEGTVNVSGSLMQISSTTVFQGHYSADCAISDTIGTAAYTYDSFSPVPVLYHREYVRVSSLPPSGASTDLFGIMDNIGTGTHLGTIAIQNDGSNYRWKIEYYSNGVNEIAYSTQVVIKANSWYYVEVLVKSGSGTGQVAVWIAEDLHAINEASPTINIMNLSNGEKPIGTAFFGGYVTGASYPVHIYSDNVVVSDTWTGPRDFTSPTIGAISATSHSIGYPVTLSSSISDDVGIDTIVPSWNNTGTWVNQTAINAQGSKNFIASLTGIWNTNPGTVVSAIFYAKDTSANWAASSQANFTLNSYAVILSANQTGLTQQDTVRISLAVTKNGSPFTSFVANASRDGSLFARNATTSFNDTQIAATSHSYTTSSLYDTAAAENVTFTTNTLNITWAKSTYVVTLSGNQSSLIQSDAVKINLAVTKNGLAFTDFLANVSRDNTLFASNIAATFNDQQTAAITHSYNISSLYDAVTGENVTFTTNTLIATWAKNTYAVTLFVNQTNISQKDVVNIYLNVTKNGLVYNSFLANISKDNALFASNATINFNDTESAAASHIYSVSSMYDVTNAENVTFTSNALNITWAQGPPTPTPTPTPISTPTPRPTATPTPKPTATPTPFVTASPSPTSTVTSTPNKTQEGLSIVAIAAIFVVVIAIIVIALLLLVKMKKIKL